MDPVLEGALMAKVFCRSNPSQGVVNTADYQALARQYEELKAALGAAEDEIHELKAVEAGDNVLRATLGKALQEENPDHPLISPFEDNPVRQKIFEDAYYKALAGPNL